MEKDKIKQLVREALEGKNTDKEYSFIQRALDGGVLKASQVMELAGMGKAEDSTSRSLFSKKIRKEKNDEGGVYLFNDEELAKIVKILSNPKSYL